MMYLNPQFIGTSLLLALLCGCAPAGGTQEINPNPAAVDTDPLEDTPA